MPPRARLLRVGCSDSAPAAISAAPQQMSPANAVELSRAPQPASKPPAAAPAQITTISSATSEADTPPLSIE